LIELNCARVSLVWLSFLIYDFVGVIALSLLSVSDAVEAQASYVDKLIAENIVTVTVSLVA